MVLSEPGHLGYEALRIARGLHLLRAEVVDLLPVVALGHPAHADLIYGMLVEFKGDIHLRGFIRILYVHVGFHWFIPH